ncbi:MAG: hypothetical protein AAF224_00340 [Pseudomonadota bacterium]
MGAPVRSDILVSVAVALWAPDGAAIEPKIQSLSADLMRRFEYWEVLIVTATSGAALAALRNDLVGLRNIRLIAAPRGTDFYRLRTIAASEAIGDIVVLTTMSELAYVDITAITEPAVADKAPVAYERSERVSLISPVSAALSLISGYDVSERELLTAAWPREALNRVLDGASPDLDLRFDRRGQQKKRLALPVGVRVERDSGGIGRRIALAGGLLSHAAPRMLGIMAALGAFGAFGGAGYAVYAAFVFILYTNVADGWLTTSLALSAMLFVLSAAVCALSLGMVRVLDQTRGGLREQPLEEFDGLSLFRDATALNVDDGSPHETT